MTITNVQVVKYRLVCLNRSVFISFSDIEKVSKASVHYQVHFKDTSKTILRIRRNILQRLLKDYPSLTVI